MATEPNPIQIYLNDFQHLVKKPECFLSSEDTLSEAIKTHLKQIYDFSKTQELRPNRSNGLQMLLIQQFDIEQIWQELELQNNSILSKSINDVTHLIVNKNKLLFPNLVESDIINEESYEQDKNVDLSETESNANEQEGVHERNAAIEEDEELEGESGEDEAMEVDDNSGQHYNKKQSIVDDNFFKLAEMENFLNLEDKKEVNQNPKKKIEESESEDDESIDLFEDEDDNLEDEADKSKTAKFKDFFRSNEIQNKDKPKRNKFLEEWSDNEDKNESKSSLELRQERLQKRIEEMEEKAVSEKPWTLQGEILAQNRPQNSLLEEILEFDLTSRPAPIITENTTLQLEDIIKQRIKDKAFDSVVRKQKPVETPLEYKKKLLLDQEKSKHSLAQIYEKEYLDQKAALDPSNAEKEEEEPALHLEIKKMMNSLFNKLDALSNFHFTPKPAIPELRVVNNLPAITMEEVAPVTANEASLLAPEEVRNKPKGDILGQSEKTKTDKKRGRRKKKLKQKKHTEIVNKNMLSNGINPARTKGVDVLKNRNTHKMEESNSKSVKSSKAFFTQLQEQAKAHIDKNLQSSGKKKKNKIDARKVKL